MSNTEKDTVQRRDLITGGAIAAGAALIAGANEAQAQSRGARSPYADPAEPALPASNMTLTRGRVALVVIDPQNDFLAETGVAWGVVGESVREQNTIENLERVFRAAKAAELPTFVSPHYYYPHDHGWRFEGALEKVMHSIHMFDRASPLNLDGFANSGADWLPRLRPFIEDGKTIVTSPHKMYGPETNDLVLQLRKQHIDQIILAGMSANLCVESHMRELAEQGFEIAVVRDATAGAKIPDGDGYLAALINFRMIANAVWRTSEAVERIEALRA
ncbi:MAG: cysteine hydrolase [Hyphomonadaceae bacterium]